MSDILNLAYSTTTGQAPVSFVADLPPVERAAVEVPVYEREAFCFVCGRCTEHFAEHDDLAYPEDGSEPQAFYGKDGSVYTKAQWDAWANPDLHAGKVR